MLGNRGFQCNGGPWDGKKLYLTTPYTNVMRIGMYVGRYIMYKANSWHVKWESRMEGNGLFHAEIESMKKRTVDIGKVVEQVESSSKALKTVMARHEFGFSITHYRRFFQHLAGVEIPNSSVWHMVRCQHWNMGMKLFDIADAQFDVVEPLVPIAGDVDG